MSSFSKVYDRHTPAPWCTMDGFRIIRGFDGSNVATLVTANKSAGEIADNARILAAAPETERQRDELREENRALVAALERLITCESFAINGTPLKSLPETTGKFKLARIVFDDARANSDARRKKELS